MGRWVQVAVLVIGLTFSAPLMGADIVCLARHDKPPVVKNIQPLMVRELLRQAVLIAARDEMGLATRDEVLGEAVDNVTGGARVNPVINYDDPFTFDLTDASGKSVLRLPLPRRQWMDDFAKSSAQAEALSHDQFVKALQQLGFSGKPIAKDPAGALDPKSEKQLESLDLIEQWMAVRRTHEQLRTQGESPARLAALARGYANLWMLTGFRTDGGPKAMAARALLYGQRAVAQFPESAQSHYGLAYACALVGHHTQAQASLKRAQTIDASAPWWTVPLEDFIHYHTAALLGRVADAPKPLGDLAQYLAFLTVEDARAWGYVVSIAKAGLDRSPACLHYIERINRFSGPGLANWASEAGNEAFSTMLGQLDEVPGTPDDITKLVRDLRRPGGNAGGRIALFNAFHKLGETDRGEPSWGAFEALARDITFIHVLRRANHIAFKWGQSATDYVEEKWPLVKDHRYANLVAAMRDYGDGNREAFSRRLKGMRAVDPTLSMHDIGEFFDWRGLEEEQKSFGWEAQLGRMDRLAPDLDYFIGCYFTLKDGEQPHRAVAKAVDYLKIVSPGSPYWMTHNVYTQWPKCKEDAERWLGESQSYPSLMLAVARQRFNDGEFDVAAGLYESLTTISPDMTHFTDLATCYDKMGDDEKWFATMNAYLKTEDLGLGHAKARIMICDRYLAKNDPKSALPYAEAAARTYAAWALLKAADVHARLGNWNEAEAYVRRNADNYNQPGEWLQWCLLSGHGNLAAATQSARAHLLEIEKKDDRESKMTRVVLLFCLGDHKAALVQADSVLKETADPAAGLIAMMVHVRAKNTAGRNAAIEVVTTLGREFKMPGGKKRETLVATADYLKKALAEPKPTISIDAVDPIAAMESGVDAPNAYYFAGIIARSLGDNDTAAALFRKAIASPSHKAARTFAAMELREMKLPVDPVN